MKNIFLEDIAYGIYDRPGPTGQVADLDKKEEITVPESTPVLPSNQQIVQIANPALFSLHPPQRVRSIQRTLRAPPPMI